MTPKPRKIAIIAATMMLLASANFSIAAEPSPQTVDQLRIAVANVLTRNHVPGAGIALVTKDKVIWAVGVGKANLATGKDVDADTMFRIASITKCFVALSIMKLSEDGKLSLDARFRF